MDLEIRPSGRGALLVVRGRMTSDDGSTLGQAIDELLRAGCRDFVLDLGAASYIDSAGLGEIVRAYSAVSRASGTLKLLKLSGRIKDLLSIAKVPTASPFARWFDRSRWSATLWIGGSILLVVVVAVIWKLTGAFSGR
jgi:anti-sigma B factor antagonist